MVVTRESFFFCNHGFVNKDGWGNSRWGNSTLSDNGKTYEPRHEISNNVVCATSKASDQPAQSRSLIRAFASRLNII